MRPSPHYKRGEKIGGKYFVALEPLQGGMGEVYRCFDIKSRIPLVLKTFQGDYIDARNRQDLFNEVNHWVALKKHSNIVRCYWMEVVDNLPFVFLEWVYGLDPNDSSLARLQYHGRFEAHQVLEMVIDTCRGLKHAHKNGVVHRDLKPGNILITQDGLAKITDFGLAGVSQMVGGQKTDGMNVAGTPPYMSPEQWLGQAPDPRMDIYAVGCILFELLTGKPPYLASSFNEYKARHLNAPIPQLRDNTQINPIIARCLAKTPRDRYQSADELEVQLVRAYQQTFGKSPRAEVLGEEFSASDYNNRGRTYAEMGRDEDAIVDYSRAIELFPRYAIAYNNRAISYDTLGKHAEASADFDRSIEIDPNSSMMLSNRSGSYARVGNFKEALADAQRSVELAPNDPVAYMNRGVVYAKIGEPDKGLEDCNKAIQMNPNLAPAYHNRASIYLQQNRAQDALVDYNHALKLDPFLTRVYLDRGTFFAGLGDWQKAYDDFFKVIDLSAEIIELSLAWNNLARLFHEVGDFEKALDASEQAIQVDPSNPNAFFNRGLSYAHLQQYPQTLADFDRAIELDPNMQKAYFNRGKLKSAMGLFQEALEDYDKAIELDPQDISSYVNRGNLFQNIGSIELAIIDYNQAIRIDPQNAMPYYNFGVLRAREGELVDALLLLEKATELGHPMAREAVEEIKRNLY